MKPPFLATTTLLSRIGSPAATGLPHDGADEIFDGVRPVGLFEEARIGGVRRPGLPADIAVADHLADAEIGLGDQHFDRGERRWGRRRLRRLGRARAAREPGGNAAGEESDTKYDQARRSHYASLSW